MTLLDRLERRFGRWAVPNVSSALIAGQICVYAMTYARPDALPNIALVSGRVLDGEVWRILTFVFEPPLSNPICALFFWYIFYLMSSALEATWGAFRFNVYLMLGWMATVGVSFLTPEEPASVAFLQGSVFLAFAWLYPSFVLYLFFVLPVKVKWLALLQWIGYFLILLFAPWAHKVVVLAAIANFLVFFSGSILLRIRTGRRRMAYQTAEIRARHQARHRCVVCGITNLTSPNEDFRYCSKCEGAHCYCSAHLRNHEHIVEKAEVG
jgi:hypothetical protein